MNIDSNEEPPSKRIKQVYLSNILECYYKSYDLLPEKQRLFWRCYDTLDANRALLYGDDYKAVVTSSPINPEHLKNIFALMKWRSVINLSPKNPSSSLCQDCTLDKLLKDHLVKLIKNNPGIEIIPYRPTAEFYRLINYLEKLGLTFVTPETVSEKEIFIQSYINSKRGFRHIWSKAMPRNGDSKINIPLGFITGNKEEAIAGGWWFRQQNRAFVVKYNKGTQGIGVLFVYPTEVSALYEHFSQQMEKKLADKIWNETPIVIEELIEINKEVFGGSPNIELFIDQDGRVHPSYACEQIMALDKKTFRGVYIHPDLYRSPLIMNTFKAGIYFGEEISRLGYHGIYDVDLVISKDQKVYAVESNLRRTGGTHIHEAAQALLGKKYYLNYYVVGEDIKLPKNVKYDYNQSYQLLNGLHFNPQAGFGFIFGNPDLLEINFLHALFIARSANDMTKLRNEVAKRFNLI